MARRRKRPQPQRPTANSSSRRWRKCREARNPSPANGREFTRIVQTAKKIKPEDFLAGLQPYSPLQLSHPFSSFRRVFLLPCLLATATVSSAAEEEWPEFRGPTAQGHTTATHLPLEWSTTKN